MAFSPGPGLELHDRLGPLRCGYGVKKEAGSDGFRLLLAGKGGRDPMQMQRHVHGWHRWEDRLGR